MTENMRINVKLYGGMKRHAPGKNNEFEMRLKPGDTLADAMNRLSVSEGHYVSLINGKRAIPSTVFKNGDTLVLFPPVSGG